MQPTFVASPDARLRTSTLVGTMIRESPDDGAPPGQPFPPFFQYNTPTWPGAYPPAVLYQLPQALPHPYYANHGLPSYNGQFEFAGAYSQSPGGQFGAAIPNQQWQQTQQPVYLYSQQPPSQYNQYDGSSGQIGSPVHYSVPVNHLANIYQPGNRAFGVAIIQQNLSERDLNRSMPSSGVYQAPDQRSSLQEKQAGITTKTPRGPPKKPKQSGHALWVGNIPSGTSIWSLKDHFSSGTMKEIESLFLISKSNCAFVNYSTEAACNFAVEKFNHSVFQGIRLVCRRRGNSNSVLTSSTGSSSIVSGLSSGSIPHQSPAPDISDDEQDDQHPEDKSINATNGPDRFFVLKSLTVQDLEQCVRQGVWTTQAQNERLLNGAYESGVDVYLIFSVNKSGEYFGYARMASSISEHAQTTPNTADLWERPIYTYTPATESAPKGRITNDPPRGTIFWEAMPSDEENSVGKSSEDQKFESASQMRERTFLVD